MRAASCIFHVGNVMENLPSLLVDFTEVIHGPLVSLSILGFHHVWLQCLGFIVVLRCIVFTGYKWLLFCSLLSLILVIAVIFCASFNSTNLGIRVFLTPFKEFISCLWFLKICNLVWNLLWSNKPNLCQCVPLQNKERNPCGGKWSRGSWLVTKIKCLMWTWRDAFTRRTALMSQIMSLCHGNTPGLTVSPCAQNKLIGEFVTVSESNLWAT